MSHVIVCGLGQVGTRVVNLLLRLGESVTVVTQETRQEFLDEAQLGGAKIVTGDARSDHVLLSAGLQEAKAILACVDDDVTNIEIALDARRLCTSIRIVARIFDQALARRLESTVGIDRALSMSVLAAPTFAAAAFGESLFGSFTHQGVTYIATKFESEELPACERMVTGRTSDGVTEVLIPFEDYRRIYLPELKGRSEDRRSLREGFNNMKRLWNHSPKVLRFVALTILALATISVFVFQVGLKVSFLDAFYFVVTTVTTTGYGDITVRDASTWLKLYGCLLMLLGSAGVATLYSLITDFIVTTRFDEILGRRATGLHGHVVVVGLGNVGYRTTDSLVALGSRVSVVDIDSDAPFRQFLGKQVVFTAGDGRDTEALERAGVRSAKAVIAATQNDAVNLSAGLAARTLNPHARVVVRIFDAGFAKKVEDVQVVDTAMSASRIASPGFVGATLFPDALLCYVHSDHYCIVKEDAENNLTIESVKLRA